MKSLRKGNKNPNWKGGYKINRGYIFIHNPEHPYQSKGYVREHRLVIEKQIGRYLLPIEEVHHLGKKSDNCLKMLMAFSNHSAHIKFEKNPDNIKPEEIIFDGREYGKN